MSHCEKQPPSNLIRPEPCERHRREMVRRGYGPCGKIRGRERLAEATTLSGAEELPL